MLDDMPDPNPTSLPNYNNGQNNSDNGTNAVELAQFYMQMNKEESYPETVIGNAGQTAMHLNKIECPHGVNYETGEVHGKRQSSAILAVGGQRYTSICPCCTRTNKHGFAHSNPNFQNGHCEYCRRG